MSDKEKLDPSHFQGKSAINHIAEKQAQGLIFSAEVHGVELPGHFSAAMNGARETALFLVMIWLLATCLNAQDLLLPILAAFGAGWIVWMTGRSAWLGWIRLERLHRILEQEKWEIEHNRPQEREELKELYSAKGFEGKLLEDVVDVLMADGDRLLRVMVEEELGLRLESQDHPLKQAFGTFLGCLTSLTIVLLFSFFSPFTGPPIAAATLLAAATGSATQYEKNRLMPAVLWNVGVATLAVVVAYFLSIAFFSGHRHT